MAEGHGFKKAQPKDQLLKAVLQDHRCLKKKLVAEGQGYKKAQHKDLFMVNRKKLQNKLDGKKHIDKITICNRVLI